MTPKEASVELELIRQQLPRLTKIVGITPADYSVIQGAAQEIERSLVALEKFVRPLRLDAPAKLQPCAPSQDHHRHSSRFYGRASLF